MEAGTQAKRETETEEEAMEKWRAHISFLNRPYSPSPAKCGIIHSELKQLSCKKMTHRYV